VVHGAGFTFQAPASWTVAGNAAVDGAVNRVEVLPFRLLRAYDAARRAAAARELDGLASRVAQQLKGTASAGRELQVAGYDARAYTISFDGKVEEITFVLHGTREYELLCRHAAGSALPACAELLASFRPRP